jgi:exonuclease III
MSVNSIKILQWNCKGLNKDKKTANEIIQKEKNVQIICLQETKHIEAPKLTGHTIYHKKSSIQKVAKGGVMIAIKEGLNSEGIKLNTPIIAVAAKVYIPEEFVICNVCNHPTKVHRKCDWDNLLNHLGKNL